MVDKTTPYADNDLFFQPNCSDYAKAASAPKRPINIFIIKSLGCYSHQPYKTLDHFSSSFIKPKRRGTNLLSLYFQRFIFRVPDWMVCAEQNESFSDCLRNRQYPPKIARRLQPIVICMDQHTQHQFGPSESEFSFITPPPIKSITNCFIRYY